eukprot:5887094-Prymnesium_polylepis.1
MAHLRLEAELEKPVRLVQHQYLEAFQPNRGAIAQDVNQAARCGDHHVRARAHLCLLQLDGPAIFRRAAKFGRAPICGRAAVFGERGRPYVGGHIWEVRAIGCLIRAAAHSPPTTRQSRMSVKRLSCVPISTHLPYENASQARRMRMYRRRAV